MACPWCPQGLSLSRASVLAGSWVSQAGPVRPERAKAVSYPGKVAPPFGTWATEVPPLVLPGCLQLLLLALLVSPVRSRLREACAQLSPASSRSTNFPRAGCSLWHGPGGGEPLQPPDPRLCERRRQWQLLAQLRRAREGNLGQKGERTGSSDSHGRGERTVLILAHGPKYSPSFLLRARGPNSSDKGAQLSPSLCGCPRLAQDTADPQATLTSSPAHRPG